MATVKPSLINFSSFISISQTLKKHLCSQFETLKPVHLSLNFSSLIFEFLIQIEIEHAERWVDAQEQQQQQQINIWFMEYVIFFKKGYKSIHNPCTWLSLWLENNNV